MSPVFRDNDTRLDWRKIGYHARSAFAVLLSLGVLLGGGWFIYAKANDAYVAWRTEDDFMGEGTESVEVLIPMGPTPTQVGDILTEAGVVKSTKAFRKVAIESGQWSQLVAGRYQLKKELPAETAFAMLMDKSNIVRLKVTFPEGTTLAEQQTILAKKFSLNIDDVKAAADPAAFAEILPSYAGNQMQGYLFPSTYEVAEPVVTKNVIATQLRQFNKIATDIGLEGRAAELKTTPAAIVITASIIAAEVPKAEDQPMVAAVIYNRLSKAMKLEMDSTVHYVVGKTGTVTTTAADRAVDSPYNTYLYPGLPPAPISNPGETALRAALNPAATDALFFVTVDLDSGETLFAATLEEHNANVKKFQDWCAAHSGRC